MEAVRIENFTFRYPESENQTLQNISLSVNAGEFVVLCGASGSGKTTLLRAMKTCLAPHGEMQGFIHVFEKNLKDYSEREQACMIGFVQQSPEHQIVTDKVWHELAFGLECIGTDNDSIRRLTAEMAQFFGINDWLYQSTDALSGGQKQLLSLASVMVMKPKLLILDEPTAQLDPIAASEFLHMLERINRELGTTIILSEHRLEEALPLADVCVVMDGGTVLIADEVAKVGAFLKKKKHPLFQAFPTAMRLWASVETALSCPISVRDGREFLESVPKVSWNSDSEEKIDLNRTHISLKEVHFRYRQDEEDILKGASLEAYGGELFCIVGGNGSGKSTLLKVIAGVKKPQHGTVECNGYVTLLPQNPEAVFSGKTVREDLNDALKNAVGGKQGDLQKIINVCGLSELLERHPFDLSGGEQQRAALAKVLVMAPDILLLDEPTKGMDVYHKEELAELLHSLKAEGICILIVSHDIEFCAQYADRCGMFFDGTVVSIADTREFFKNNHFYTTAARRIAKGIDDEVVTTQDGIRSIGGAIEAKKQPRQQELFRAEKQEELPKQERMSFLRKAGAFICGLAALVLYLYTVKTESMKDFIGSKGITVLGVRQLILYGVFLLLLIGMAGFLGKGSRKYEYEKQTTIERRKLSKRTKVAMIFILLCIPLTLYVGVFYLAKKQYYVTATLVLLESMVPFFLSFEGKKPKARELVTIASLCAISIAGRAMFFMIPQFKPVLAMTIISGAALGGEAGFLVGAVTMLVSNIMFSQGPWTAWQMFAMGIIGFLAGVLYRKGWLVRTRLSLALFGIITAFLVYGGIMNPASLLMWSSENINLKMLLAYYITGFPMDAIHGFATAIFLWFGAEPMLEKLERIKTKYGMLA